MSAGDGGSRNRFSKSSTSTTAQTPVRVLRNVKIVAIYSVESLTITTLTRALIVNNQNESLLRGTAPAPDDDNYMTLADAKRDWFKVDQMEEYEDPSDVAAFIAGSGIDSDQPGVHFDANHEERFKRNVKGLQIKAECLIEYDVNQQPLEVFGDDDDTGFGGGNDECDSSDDDDGDSDPEYERKQQQKRARLPPKMERCVVIGIWPTLSPSIPLVVASRQFASSSLSARDKRYDATREDCYIRPHYDSGAGARVSIGDFSAMLRHGPAMHPNGASSLVRSLFPSVFGTELRADGRGQCVDTVRGADGIEPLCSRDPLSNTVALSELTSAIATSPLTSMTTLIHERSVFASIAVLFLFRKQVAAIIECYGSKRWCDIVARGHVFVQKLYVLMTRLPHVLCMSHLKYVECTKMQQAAREKLNNTKEANSIAAALRWLAAMPEMQVPAYLALLERNTRERIEPNVPHDQRDMIRVAVDIYGSIVKHDLHSGDFTSDDARRRRESSGRGISSGHLFSVFGNIPGPLPTGTTHDSGYSDGTLCIDDYIESEEAQRRISSDTLAQHQQQTATASSTATTQHRHSNNNSNYDSIPDFLPIVIKQAEPIDQPEAQQQTTAAGLPRQQQQCQLDSDIARLTQHCDSLLFCYALRWLVQNGVVEKFTHIGTGPYNKGQRFDAFYESRIWRAQTSIVENVVALYKQGLEEQLGIGADMPLMTPEEYKERITFRDAARAHLRATLRHAQAQAAAQKTVDGLEGTELASKYTQDIADDDSARERMAALHGGVAEFFEEMPPVDLTCQRPLQVPDDDVAARLAASNLSDQQREGVWFALRSGLTIFMAPGGSGKTRVATEIYASYPAYQIAVCALTAKACEVLTQNIGKVSTIHTLLLKETLHRQRLASWRQRVKRLEFELARLQRLIVADGAELEPGQPESENLARVNYIRSRIAIERLVGCSETVSPVEDVRIVMVDEMSLVDINLMRMLLEMMRGKLCKLIVLGDVNQLASIDAGSVLADLCRAFPHCVKMFTKNFRSKGRAIFDLGRSIVLHKPSAHMRDFGRERNLGRLARSTTPADATDVAAADDASLVFLSTDEVTLPRDLRNVLQMLGAYVPGGGAPTAASLEARSGIHIIAHTNAAVKELNEICRTLYHGQLNQSTGQHELAPMLHHKLLPTDKFYFRRNFDDRIEVSREAFDDAASIAENQLASFSIIASSASTGFAGGEDDDGDEALDDDSSSSAVGRLHSLMASVGAPLESDSMLRVRIKAFNSEIVTLVDLYERPKRMTSNTYCICGRCPAPPPNTPGIAPATCVRWPHVVPLRRRAFNLQHGSAIRFHDQGIRRGDGGNVNRMAVLRSQNGTYRQFNVEKRLLERSAWDYGFATTVTRFQGSGTKTIILVMMYFSTYADLALAYTSVLRAEERFIFMGTEEIWRRLVQRSPFVRRSEMWLLMARGVCAAHTGLASGAQHPHMLADRLGVPTDAYTERHLLRSDRTIGDDDREQAWRYFDKMREATLARAGLSEL